MIAFKTSFATSANDLARHVENGVLGLMALALVVIAFATASPRQVGHLVTIGAQRRVLTGCLVVPPAIVILAIALASGPTSSVGRTDAVALPEPMVGASFVRSYANVDAEGIARLASPLYRVELGRRGNANGRAFLPVPWDGPASPPSLPWLQFTYVDGIVDDSGFTSLLYVARSTVVEGSRAPLTVWRVDLDPSGRIIWGDVVFGFGPAHGFSAQHVTDVRLETLPTIPVPPTLGPIWPMLRPRVLLIITSTNGMAYYVLGLIRKDRVSPSPEFPTFVLFFARDGQGHVLSDAWSYGQPTYREVPGAAPAPVGQVPVILDDHDETLWHRYVMTLW